MRFVVAIAREDVFLPFRPILSGTSNLSFEMPPLLRSGISQPFAEFIFICITPGFQSVSPEVINTATLGEMSFSMSGSVGIESLEIAWRWTRHLGENTPAGTHSRPMLLHRFRCTSLLPLVHLLGI